MKKVLIGGFMSIVGSIWALAVIVIAANNLTSGWTTPPGRLLTTISELGLMLIFIAAVLLVMVGIVIMAFELFEKDQP